MELCTFRRRQGSLRQVGAPTKSDWTPSDRLLTILMWASTLGSMLIGLSVLVWADEQGIRAESSRGSGLTLKTLTAHSRLEFPVDPKSKAEFKNTGTGFEIRLRGTTLTDLGAPFGGEEAWLRGRERIEDHRIHRLKIREEGDDVVIRGDWRFPTGAAALAKPEMDRFEYRQKGGSLYVVDFWVKKGPTLTEAKKIAVAQAKKAALEKQIQEERKREQRRIAFEELKKKSDRVTDFCDVPLSPENDVFLTLRPHHESFDFSQYISTSVPDRDYLYQRPAVDAPDAANVRVALDLYEKQSFGLVIRAIEFFEKDFPKSSYKFEMQFLKANALFRLGYADSGRRMLEEIMSVAPESAVALQSGMYVAVKAVEEGRTLAAYESFLWLIQRYPRHRLSWVFHMGAAEGAYALKQTERAAIEYDWVIKNAPHDEEKYQAAFRLGDVYMARQEYEAALSAYFRGMQLAPAAANQFASLQINRAESLYQLGKYEESEKAFLEFSKRFPNHPGLWRAFYRLGEISGREFTPEKVAKSRKYFLDTINHKPFSLGATLARLRLVPCGDQAGFDASAFERFVEQESKKVDGETEIVMDRYRDYRVLAEVRAWTSFQKTDRAVDLAIAELQGGVRFEARPILRDSVRQIMRKETLSRLESGRSFEALKFYLDRADRMPTSRESSTLVSPDYLMQLSRAAAELKMGAVAQRLASEHERAQKLINREIASQDSGAGDVHMRLKKSEQSYIQAHALWVSQGMSADSEVRALLSQVSDESEHAANKSILLSQMDSKAKKTIEAVQHAKRAQLLLGERAGARLLYWIVELQVAAGEIESAIEGIRYLRTRSAEEREDTLGSTRALPPVAPEEQLVFLQSDLFGKLGKWKEAALALEGVVKNGQGGNQALYEFSRALKKTGSPEDLVRSEQVLKTLSESKTDDLWRSLANVNPNGNSTGNAAKEGTP